MTSSTAQRMYACIAARQKRGFAAGELKQRRAHGTRLAHGEPEGQATDSRLAAREAFTRLV